MIRIPQSQDYHAQTAKCGDIAPCAVCGKPTPNPRWALRTWYGSHAVTADDVVMLQTSEGQGPATASGDTGMAPIGRDCLRQHPELLPYAIRQ